VLALDFLDFDGHVVVGLDVLSEVDGAETTYTDLRA
jgi:hypothetical protein